MSSISNSSLFLFVLSLSALIIALSDASSTGFLSDRGHRLEDMYVEDCEQDQSPHGFYGAFFQPCEFSFYMNGDNEVRKASDWNSCTLASSILVGQPTAVHWIFELQKHIDRDDWDELSSQDIPDFDELMLWPDQCVGVSARCYALESYPSSSVTSNKTSSVDIESSFKVLEALGRLLPDGIPAGATHVQVDCRADAMELSRVAFAVASGLEKSIPVTAAWISFLILLLVLGMSFCCCGCFRLCGAHRRSTGQNYLSYHVIPGSAVADDDYVTSLAQSETANQPIPHRRTMVELSKRFSGPKYQSICE
jgi:hypothetical protein